MNFFLLNKWINGQIYSSKSSGFVVSGFFPIFLLSCSLFSVACVLLVLNLISWCFILQLSRHLINYIIPFFQLTSWLCLTSWLYSKNMSVPFKSVTAVFNYSLCLLILIFRGTTLVISLFFVLSILNTSNEKLIGFVWILLSFTNCLLISVYVYLESTNILTLKFLSFFFIFACIFNSLSELLHYFGIIYFIGEFTLISCTVPTWDLLQNPSSFCLLLDCLILLKPFVSSSIVFLCNSS